MKLYNTPTFLFYDYETFGLDTQLDKPAQFACVRTDVNFNIISDPQCFYCFPPDDYLPDPNSVLITKITPQYTKKNGINECYFAKKIHEIFMISNTCILGYNNIHFDDEITRNIFYRNFFDPYEWSWKNNNTRWDILNLLRACYALRPDGIKWCKNALGFPSFRLSDLTRVNNIMHLNVHNAVSDVYATVAMTRLVKNQQPKLFDFFFKYRTKKKLYTLINIKNLIPVVYVSPLFGAVRHNISCVMPIIWDKNNANILISIDLFANVTELIMLVNKTKIEEDISKKLFNLGIILLYFNRCPILAPIQTLRIPDFERLNLNYQEYKKNINLLKQNIDIFIKIQQFLDKKNRYKFSLNVDTQIYNAFFHSCDKRLINKISNTNFSDLTKKSIQFDDARLKEIFFRYRARNFFYSLSNTEKNTWISYCRSVFNQNYSTEYQNKINILYKKYSNNKKKISLLQELENYFFYITKKYS